MSSCLASRAACKPVVSDITRPVNVWSAFQCDGSTSPAAADVGSSGIVLVNVCFMVAKTNHLAVVMVS
jgi:hypothetical protein